MADGKDNDFDNLDDFDLDSELQDDTEIDFPSEDSTVDTESAVGDEELEKYGVWVKVKPETVEDTLEDMQATDLADLDSTETTLTEEEEQLLSELEEETLEEDVGLSEEEISGLEQEPELEEEEEELGELGTMPSALDDLGDIESEDQTESEPGEELPELTVEGEEGIDEIEVPLSEDISIEEDLSTFADEEIATAGEAGEGRTADVLAKIEQELQEIKNELSALKSELTHLQRPAGEEVEVKPVEEEAKGFFSEEEDETIALTGDEPIVARRPDHRCVVGAQA